jgi:hypothetical protein
MKSKPAAVNKPQIDKVTRLVHVTKRAVIQIVKGNPVFISQGNPWNDLLYKGLEVEQDLPVGFFLLEDVCFCRVHLAAIGAYFIPETDLQEPDVFFRGLI